MPVDPAGNPVRIGWPETEMLWLRAASTLCLKDRESAFKDIASLTSRSVDRIRHKAALIRAEDRRLAKLVLDTQLRKNWLSETAPASPRRVFVPERSQDRSPRKPSPLKVAAE